MVRREKKVARRLKYECPFLRVYEDDVTLPGGKRGRRVVVDHDGAAAVLPFTRKGDVILVKQHRYVAGIDSLEIPAGKKDEKGEDGRRCALRELEEETGHVSDALTWLTSIYSAIGFSNERIDIYAAYDVYPTGRDVLGDDDEYLEIVKMPFEEALAMAKQGDIMDAKTVVALLMAADR